MGMVTMDDHAETSIDLGLVNTNDDSEVFLKTPERRRRPLPLTGLHARKLSSTYSTPSSPDLTERQSRSKSVHITSPLVRSRTLPRSYPKNPVHESTSSCLDAPALDAEVVSKLRRWIICAIVVNFDLDLGPAVDGIYPPCPLSTQEKENICFSSFPDSPAYEEGTEAFTFRMREMFPSPEDDLERGHEKRAHLSQDGFIYGFSYFSRRKDNASLRGYDQRSLVLLTSHPWPSIFLEIVNRLGPMFLAHGGPMLESACHNIASWPAPDPGITIELGFLGSVLHVELPGSIDQQQTTETASFQEKFDPSVHILASMSPMRPSPLRLFAASLTHIWSIWECIVLNEPLLIFGTSPMMTSQAIWWLLDVLRPMPFAGDFRPYFTIHDKDFHSLVNKKQPKAGLLLGVTNPIFASSCKHWPHKLSLGTDDDDRPRRGGSIKIANIAGPPPGWETRTHNRYISKDRELLKILEKEIRKASSMDADGKLALLLRRHFTTRAVQFLIPLNRYLNTLIPTPASGLAGSNSSKHPSLKPFNRDHFFVTLKTHGTPLPFRSSAKQREFYERWLRSPAFGLWMARQEEAINTILRKSA